MNAPAAQPSPADTIHRLNALAAELSARGWTADVSTPRGKRPRVRARNPEPGAGVLCEDIYALADGDGTWAYWWPWAQPIAENPARAAAIIVHALRTKDTP